MVQNVVQIWSKKGIQILSGPKRGQKGDSKSGPIICPKAGQKGDSKSGPKCGPKGGQKGDPKDGDSRPTKTHALSVCHTPHAHMPKRSIHTPLTCFLVSLFSFVSECLIK